MFGVFLMIEIIHNHHQGRADQVSDQVIPVLTVIAVLVAGYSLSISYKQDYIVGRGLTRGWPDEWLPTGGFVTLSTSAYPDDIARL